MTEQAKTKQKTENLFLILKHQHILLNSTIVRKFSQTTITL